MHEEGSDPVNGKLQWFELDVEASSKIKDVAAAFLEEEGRPNVLGCKRMRTPYVLGERELQRRRDGIPITVMSMHLGWVYTECFLRDPLQDSPILGYLQIFFLKLTFRTPTEEAHASVYAAVLPDVGRGEIASRCRTVTCDKLPGHGKPLYNVRENRSDAHILPTQAGNARQGAPFEVNDELPEYYARDWIRAASVHQWLTIA
ncbi:hypothetical protein BD309DRAFT_984659 [Dichomitus squalens]|nr:hypothetical protein BD309DRAFT_984659 [Dichomitus squalens]